MNSERLRLLGIFILIAGATVWAGLGAAAAQQVETGPAEEPVSGIEETEATQESKKKSEEWYEKGILFTVYGNDKAAIDQFKKVVESDPQHHDAYFQMGVSYGELGQYENALRQINKAIELNPDKAVFYYGRARVYLLSGDKEKAVADFEKAAEMGSRDAGNYLKRILEE